MSGFRYSTEEELTLRHYPIERHPKSQEFHDELRKMGEMHDRKQQDYGRPDDPFANVRNSTAFGVPAWVGCMMRANDKMVRIQTAAHQVAADGTVTMANESIEDSFMDMAVYAIIGLILYREWVNEPQGTSS